MTLVSNPKPNLIQNISLLGHPVSKHINGHVMVDYLFVHSKSLAKTSKSNPVLWQIKQPSE
jgi:hypothetical protein